MWFALRRSPNQVHVLLISVSNAFYTLPSDFDRFYPDPFQTCAKDVLVESPSLVDHEKSLEIDRGHLNEIQELKVAQLEKIEILGDEVPEVRTRGLQRSVEKEQAFMKRIVTAENSDRDIGTLLASSGIG